MCHRKQVGSQHVLLGVDGAGVQTLAMVKQLSEHIVSRKLCSVSLVLLLDCCRDEGAQHVRAERGQYG